LEIKLNAEVCAVVAVEIVGETSLDFKEISVRLPDIIGKDVTEFTVYMYVEGRDYEFKLYIFYFVFFLPFD
jgi:hypothetical protein